ncbi:hypothetical protein [Rhizobium sp. BE258]|uniref:hypothetical protein n=1 Tax=Rhizobium sp. BE258 TaxID=2817722 RepID=UPI0013AEEE05|nr:hypothetical protein [Rhizobium sp. BE258]
MPYKGVKVDECGKPIDSEVTLQNLNPDAGDGYQIVVELSGTSGVVVICEENTPSSYNVPAESGAAGVLYYPKNGAALGDKLSQLEKDVGQLKLTIKADGAPR